MKAPLLVLPVLAILTACSPGTQTSEPETQTDTFTYQNPIRNGIDTEIWSPTADKLIDENYNADRLEDKFDNKRALAKKHGFKADRKRPVVAMIARMTEQKGYDLVLEALPEIGKMETDLIIMGEGSGSIPKDLEKKTKKLKNVHLYHGYDEALAHLTFAGADILLMPSLYEPCGLNQLYAMRYGTVPVAKATGGLKDSIEPYSAKKESGDGFLFKDHTAGAMLEALTSAVELFDDRDAWGTLQTHLLSHDFSWNSAAARYVDEAYSS